MDGTSMSCDPRVAQVALAWLHLPSGAAVIQGVVRHADGGPIIAGAALRDRPLAAGGTEVLYDAADPSRGEYSDDPRTWAVTAPDAVQETLEMRGWRVVSRGEAAAVLRVQGYRLRGSGAPGHVVHDDQADELVWHPKPGLDGRAYRSTLAAFVVRPHLVPVEIQHVDVQDEATPTGGTTMLGLEPDDFRVLGLALAAFAAGPARDAADDDDREQAGFLHDHLISWGYITSATDQPATDSPKGPRHDRRRHT